jgi:hypothetical protein
MDGMLANWAVKLFKAVCSAATEANCPEKKAICLESAFRGQKPKIFLLDSAIVGEGKMRRNEVMDTYAELLNRAERPVIASDSQILCEALENLLVARGKQGLRVDSKTVSTKEVQEFLSNCERWVEENDPEYLIYSPSAESGLNISIRGYFREFYGFFCGVLDADSILQMIMRVRDPELKRTVFVRNVALDLEQAGRRSPLPRVLEWQYQQAFSKEANLAMSHPEQVQQLIAQLEQLKGDPFFTAAAELEAMWNYERWHLRDCVRELLEESGHPVTVVERQLNQETPFENLSKSSQQRLRKKARETGEPVPEAVQAVSHAMVESKREVNKAKEQVRTQNALDIYSASDKYVGKSHLKKLGHDASWAERCALEKARLLDRLPGLAESELWTEGGAEFVLFNKYREPRNIAQLEQRYLLFNPEVARALAAQKFEKVLERAEEGELMTPWRMKNRYLTTNALRKLGIHSWLEESVSAPDFYDKGYTADSPEVEELCRLGRTKEVRRALGRGAGREPMKFVNWLLSLVGVRLHPSVRRDGDKITRIYRFCRSDFLDNCGEDCRQAPTLLEFISTKFARMVKDRLWRENSRREADSTPDVAGDSSVTLPTDYYKNTVRSVTARDHTQPGLQTAEEQKNGSGAQLYQNDTKTEGEDRFKVGDEVRFVGEPAKYWITAINGPRCMVRMVAGPIFFHTSLERLERA